MLKIKYSKSFDKKLDKIAKFIEKEMDMKQRMKDVTIIVDWGTCFEPRPHVHIFFDVPEEDVVGIEKTKEEKE